MRHIETYELLKMVKLYFLLYIIFLLFKRFDLGKCYAFDIRIEIDNIGC